LSEHLFKKMTQSLKHVVFDVVGTCVSFDAYYERIDSVMGAKLRDNTITPEHFGFTWQTDAELEFTFLSISGSYKPYKEVLRGTFYRTLSFCGIANPRTFATEDDRERCIEGYYILELRKSCSEAFQVLRNNGFTVWCFTSGDVQRVKGYFERAGVDMPEENLISCDSVGIAKPALAAYQHVWNQLGESDARWFAAAHMWDVAAATRVGFRGAWSSVYEKEACFELHEDAKFEILGGDLVDVARQIVEKSETS
jgi:2-haloacid dehalogenase